MPRHLTTLLTAAVICAAFSTGAARCEPSHPPTKADAGGSAIDIDETNKKADELVKQKKFVQARALYQQVLKSTEAKYGQDHPMLIQPLNNIVRVSCLGKQCFETIPELKRMLAIRQKAYGKDSRDVPVNLLLIGEAYEKEQKYDQALNYFQQAVDSEKRRSGGNSPLALSLAKNISRIEREKSALSALHVHPHGAVK